MHIKFHAEKAGKFVAGFHLDGQKRDALMLEKWFRRELDIYCMGRLISTTDIQEIRKMMEQHRIRKGLNEWNHVPDGYVVVPIGELIQGGDVQKINDEWYLEYPSNGLLVGTPVSGGLWYRAKIRRRIPMATIFDCVGISGLRVTHFRQLLAYIEHRELDSWYYGNEKQFEKRHNELKEWVNGIIECVESEGVKIPK